MAKTTMSKSLIDHFDSMADRITELERELENIKQSQAQSVYKRGKLIEENETLKESNTKLRDALGKLSNFALYASINKSHCGWAEHIAKAALSEDT